MTGTGREGPVRVGSPHEVVPGAILDHMFPDRDAQNTYYLLQQGRVGGQHWHLRLGETREMDNGEMDEGDRAKNPEVMHFYGCRVHLLCWQIDVPGQPVITDEVIDATGRLAEVVIEPHVGHLTVALTNGLMIEPKPQRFNPRKPGTVKIPDVELPTHIRQRRDEIVASLEMAVV